AYQAVENPVEGTILTVIRAAAEAACARWGPGSADGAGAAGQREPEAAAGPGHQAGARGEGPSLLSVLEAAREGALVALERTPELLPVLKAAGVVDSGGSGLALLFDAALHVVDGRPLPEPPDGSRGARSGAAPPDRAAGRVGEGAQAVDDLRYEVMYLLEAPDEAVGAFRQVWAGMGDSIVVVGGDGLYNCHIHTDEIGASIEAALDAGRPRDIRVTDLNEQVLEELWVREARADAHDEATAAPATAVVAVIVGDGVGRIFRSLGARGLVSGGQSMNPSTQDLVDAVRATGSAEVVILPNNKNIRPVAEQVAGLVDVTVSVVPTTSIVEGFAALLSYDPDASAQANAVAMCESATHVVAGEVTRAVRDATTDAGDVRAGDWIGLAASGVRSVADSIALAASRLLETLVRPEHELLTVIEGDGATRANTRRITDFVHEQYPGLSVEVHHGGQPLYPYYFGIE
ncbi:MAG: DAK2 domain-containing protein, partial [Acidimicrobiales bacterium]